MLETLSTVFPSFSNFTEIGRGGFSSVFSAVHTTIKDLEIAIKVVNKYEILSADDKRNFEFEVQILKRLDFPFIITFYDLRENNEFFFISMELAKKGTLLDMINEKKQLDRNTSMKIFCQLSSTLFYLHNVIDSIHRDIKVENIMFDDTMNVRLIDFGFSQIIKNKSKDSGKGKNKKIFTTLCGSYPYAAPEMLRLSPYSKPVDIWALGIVFYVCLVGKLPFDDLSIPKLAKMIVFNEPEYPENIDEDVKMLLKRLLTKNPSERPTVEEIRGFDVVKNSPYSIYFDVIGNENFMIKNFASQSESEDSEKEEDVRDIYLDADIIDNLVQLGLDPTKVFSEGTEEMLLYRAQRKKKIEQIIGDDQKFRETLNSKNIPQKLLVQVTQKSKKQQKQQQKNQDQHHNQSKSQPQQQNNQVESNNQKVQFKNHSHVEFGQQNQQQQQQKRSTPQNQSAGNQEDDIFPNYQNYKQIKANQNQQLQNPNQSAVSTAFSNSQQHLQQSLQAQIQQQVQIQLQQKQPQGQPQSQPSPFPLFINSQRGAVGNSEVTKSIVRINRKQHRSSSVASIIKMPPPVVFGSQFVAHQQPVSKTSSTGQSNQQTCSQINFQTQPNQQIMVIQKKRRAPSLGSHVPSVQSTGPPSSCESDRGHSKKIRSSTSYANEQADPSTPTSATRGQSHTQSTSTGREVAPIMRPRKKSGKGHFISIISK